MTDAPQPTSVSLQARIIRKCPVHPTCSLTCRERKVEELGEIVSFDSTDESAPPSIVQRLKEGLSSWLR
jgi:hypothetical protein